MLAAPGCAGDDTDAALFPASHESRFVGGAALRADNAIPGMGP
jgi:hypothetical protein